MTAEVDADKDQSRQWAREFQDITPHHLGRYLLASRYASGRVLDAACGCGYGSKILHEETGDVVGVDIEAEAIEWARSNFPGPQYIHGDILQAPWAGSFETVVSLETIEHLKDPRPALEGFRNCCTGSLIVSVPNQKRYPFDPGRFAKDKYPHFRHYTPEQFEELLESCGFAVMEFFCQKDKRGEIYGGADGMFLIAICE